MRRFRSILRNSRKHWSIKIQKTVFFPLTPPNFQQKKKVGLKIFELKYIQENRFLLKIYLNGATETTLYQVSSHFSSGPPSANFWHFSPKNGL